MSDSDRIAGIADRLAGIGMKTTPGPMGPTVRYRVLGEDGVRHMAVDGVDSILRYARSIEYIDAGLLVMPMRYHGRDHGPAYLFLDADEPRDVATKVPTEPAAASMAGMLDGAVVIAMLREAGPEAEVAMLAPDDAERETAREVVEEAFVPVGTVDPDEHGASVVDRLVEEIIDEADGATADGDFEPTITQGLLTGRAIGFKSGEGTGEAVASTDLERSDGPS